MKKLFNSKFWWIYLIVLLVLVNMFAFAFHFRLDLTSEKRFTLSGATKHLLQNLKSPVRITVFLEGDMPAGFRQLSNASAEMLQEFREISHNKVIFTFEKPGAGLDDTARVM